MPARVMPVVPPAPVTFSRTANKIQQHLPIHHQASSDWKLAGALGVTTKVLILPEAILMSGTPVFRPMPGQRSMS